MQTKQQSISLHSEKQISNVDLQWRRLNKDDDDASAFETTFS